MRKGSALVAVLLTLAVLSMMVMSFVYEAKRQSRINMFVCERNRANRLIDAGRVLGEIVMTKFSSAPDWDPEQETEKLLEDDRWVVEKQALKEGLKCTIGPLLLDADDLESGTITVEIEPVNSGSKGIININKLCKTGEDSKYVQRWWMIFHSHGIPERLKTKDNSEINLWNTLIASWDDWCDEDDLPSQIDGEECGAESKWYKEYEEKYDIDKEYSRSPRNGPISDIKELSFVRGFRDYPAVLTGGVINPWEKREEDQITVRGIQDLFCTDGDGKIYVNTCKSEDALITVPGIFEDPSNLGMEQAYEEAKTAAQSIIAGLSTPPEDLKASDLAQSRETWPYKDWNDILSRVEEAGAIGSEANNYFAFKSGSETCFKVKITGESSWAKREVNAICYVRDSKVRYTEWRED